MQVCSGSKDASSLPRDWRRLWMALICNCTAFWLIATLVVTSTELGKRWSLGCVNSPPATRGSKVRFSRNLGPHFSPNSVLIYPREGAQEEQPPFIVASTELAWLEAITHYNYSIGSAWLLRQARSLVWSKYWKSGHGAKVRQKSSV